MSMNHRQRMQAVYFCNAHPDAVEFTATGSVYRGSVQVEAGDQVFATPLANMQRLPQDGSMAGAWWVLVNPGARFYRLTADEFAAIGGAMAVTADG